MSSKKDTSATVAVVGLVASVFSNIAQAAANRDLSTRNAALASSRAALQRILTDWQQAYRELDAQLSRALAVNAELQRSVDELTRQNVDLRRSREQAQADAFVATQRLVEIEGELSRLRSTRNESELSSTSSSRDAGVDTYAAQPTPDAAKSTKSKQPMKRKKSSRSAAPSEVATSSRMKRRRKA
jgi:chromosome segregation ATPase